MTVQPATAAPVMPSSITQYVADYHALSELMRVAVRTDFVPKAFRPEAFIPRENRNPTNQQLAEAFEKSVASATIGAHFGMSIGVGSDPFSALQNVHVVNGKPGLYAEAAVSLVQSRGHDVWTEDLTDTRAIVCGRRAGSEHVERVVITMEQARRAGWTRNATYQSTPQDMLYARAASRVCRRVAADALKGIGFAEELQDGDATPAPTNGTRTVQRGRPAAAVAAAPEEQAERPPLPGETVVTPDGRDEPAHPIDERQWRQINARFVELGVRGQGQAEQRLRVIGDVLGEGREIKRGSQLTAAEAEFVLTNLAGHSGERIVREVLGGGPAAELERERAEQPPAPEDAPAGPPLPGEQDRPDPWGVNEAYNATSTDDVGEDADELLVPGDDQ